MLGMNDAAPPRGNVTRTRRGQVAVNQLVQSILDLALARPVSDVLTVSTGPLQGRLLSAKELTLLLKELQKQRAPLKRCFEVIAWAHSMGMSVDEFHYNALISACDKAMQWERALQAFDEMQLSGIKPGTFTYNSLISACAKGRQWEQALRLFDQMQDAGVTRDTITYNSLIAACGKAGQLDHACYVFESMISARVVRTAVTYRSLLSACGQVGDVQRGLKVLQEMDHNSGLQHDSMSYNALISACDKAGHFEQAFLTFDCDVPKDSTTYSLMISIAEKMGRYQKAQELFEQMQRANFVDVHGEPASLFT